jgi:hypothetical protein
MYFGREDFSTDQLRHFLCAYFRAARSSVTNAVRISGGSLGQAAAISANSASPCASICEQLVLWFSISDFISITSEFGSESSSLFARSILTETILSKYLGWFFVWDNDFRGRKKAIL